MAKRKTQPAAPRGAERMPKASRTVVRGERVRSLREARGWTQFDLGYRSNLGIGEISYVENNRRELRTPSFLRLVLTLGTSADYLLGLTDDPKPAK